MFQIDDNIPNDILSHKTEFYNTELTKECFYDKLFTEVILWQGL